MAKNKRKEQSHYVQVPKVLGNQISVYQYLNHLAYKGDSFSTIKRKGKILKSHDHLSDGEEVTLVK